MRRYLYMAAVAGAAALATMLPGAAFADTGAVLTYGSAGGTSVPVGDVVTASLASGTTATFYSSSTGTSGVSCTTSAFTATVTDNPAAAGVATESLTAQTFSGCTSNVFGTTSVQSVTLNNLPYTVTVDDSTNAVTVSGSPIQTTVVLGTILGTITCVYQSTNSTIAGTADNTTNSITFTNQSFTKTSGSALCFSSAFFTATYSPVADTTQGGSAVYVN
ncbi:MAG TPA: Tat pathway signal sequence domain protein [Rugosimonospora sp.]|nr:Tat pathway signal sequence domain protein [Rugosimonospora sp.]